MRLTQPLGPTKLFPKVNYQKHPHKSAKTADVSHSKYIVDEINAYIAIRDSLLAEAEEVRSCAKLDSLSVANDFVETCLKPPRPTYKAQHLSEADAARERKRCLMVKIRIAELRKQAVYPYHHPRAVTR
jgi:hypothetical protein